MAHSPIFRSMFTHPEAQEYQSGVIKITDFTQPEPMRAVVRYCYQGLLDDATLHGDGAVEIFKLADRYCIAGLKALLEKYFDKGLSVENVVAMAVLADTYTALKLKEVRMPAPTEWAFLLIASSRLLPGMHQADRAQEEDRLRERRLGEVEEGQAGVHDRSRRRDLPQALN